jgi:hypothetical protein
MYFVHEQHYHHHQQQQQKKKEEENQQKFIDFHFCCLYVVRLTVASF